MTVTIERRDGRITESEYRAVVVWGERRAEGAWEFTKRDAMRAVPALKRTAFDADEAGRIGEANVRARMARAQLEITHNRNPRKFAGDALWRRAATPARTQ